MCVISGVISSLVTGILLDKYQKYLLTLRIICWGTTLIFVITFTIYVESNDYYLYTMCILIGTLLVPILPVGSAFGGELTFPME